MLSFLLARLRFLRFVHGCVPGVILRGLEPERRERREVNGGGEGAVLPGLLLGLDGVDLEGVAAGVVGRVCVEEQTISASFGEAEAVAAARCGREVADADERVAGAREPLEGDD